MVGAVSMIVHEDATVDEASAFLNGEFFKEERRDVTA